MGLGLVLAFADGGAVLLSSTGYGVCVFDAGTVGSVAEKAARSCERWGNPEASIVTDNGNCRVMTENRLRTGEPQCLSSNPDLFSIAVRSWAGRGTSELLFAHSQNGDTSKSYPRPW